MPARTGEQYVEGLRRARTVYEIGGERLVGGAAEHPAFRNVVQTYATLFDLQHDLDLRDTMTYSSPLTGEQVSTSFLQPASRDDLVRRREMMTVWAEHSLGMLGRTGDYLNSGVQALAAAAGFFAQADPGFGRNVVRYYEHVREHDLLLTHTLIHRQANRSVPVHEQADPYLAARVVRETDSGVIVRGARLLATLGPFSDELLVFPSTVVKATAEDAPYAFAFAIPCDTPGLRFLCREPMDAGRSRFDHPLGSVRRDGRRGRLRRRRDAVRALLRPRRAGALQPLLRGHVRRAFHDAPGRDAHHREDRVLPRPRLAHDRRDPGRRIPARPGEARGDHRRAVAGYDRTPYVERVREFLHRDPSPVDELAPA